MSETGRIGQVEIRLVPPVLQPRQGWPARSPKSKQQPHMAIKDEYMSISENWISETGRIGPVETILNSCVLQTRPCRLACSRRSKPTTMWS